MIIIGVTGYAGSGKDTCADYLVTKGFRFISSSDILREEMRKEHLDLNRPSMQAYVRAMRKKLGNGYLSTIALQRISGDTVLSGLRNTEEVAVLRTALKDRFRLLAIDAPIHSRYLWVKERARPGDAISFEDFVREEEIERNNPQNGFSLDAVISDADFVIANNGSKAEFFSRIDRVLSDINSSISS